MVIGIVLPKPPRYSETFFNTKIKGLQRSGVKVVLFTQTKEPEFDLCPVVCMPRVSQYPPLNLLRMMGVFLSLSFRPKVIWRFYLEERDNRSSLMDTLKQMYLNAHILKCDMDWLHFGFLTQAVGSESVARAIGAKMAASLRGFDINQYPLNHPHCYNLVWPKLDKLHSISNFLLTKAVDFGYNSETLETEIIHPSIDENLINAVLKEPLNYRETNGVVICTVARIHWIKNLSLSIRLLQQIKTVVKEVSLIVIGAGDARELERLKLLALDLGVMENIEFKSQLTQKETLKCVLSSDFYIQTSLVEGFCNATLEAQALGKPCLVTPGGGLVENILDERTGWVSKSHDIHDVFSRFMDMYNCSETELKLVTSRARARVFDEFGLKLATRKFSNFYKSTSIA